MTNLQVAKLLRAVAAALSLSKGDNRFRIIAYQRAADAIEHSSSEVKDLWDDGELKNLSGIGASLADHLDELFRTGQVRYFAQIMKPLPPAVFELLEVPGIGPKNAFKLCQALGISSAHSALAKLEKAAKKGLIAKIPGFGADSQAKILQGLTEFQGRIKRLLLPTAQNIADDVIAWLTKIPHTKRADSLGSLRRQASTVGDVDISVASDSPRAVIAHFTKYPKKIRVLEAGEHTASLILPNDYQIDLMVQPPQSYGSLLQHFTGSKHHNIALREYALKQGLSLSEYGIKKNQKLVKFSSEESFYNFLGLDYIPPELREDSGEIEAAKNHQLPRLVELSDIKGDLQIHSNIDIEPSHDLGTSSLAELSAVAVNLGYEYIGVTEHNPALAGHTPSQILDLMKKKSEIVYKFNSSENKNEKGVHIFNGLEIDIRTSGIRALPDAALDLLDYACVSIHSSFDLDKKAMTDRVLAALDHPKVKFFAHPTARLLQQREGVELDWDRIFDFCLKNHKWLEIDGWPNRLDLPDSLAREAIKRGVKLVIDTDSHAADQLVYMRYGVAVARRAWATARDIVNTVNLTYMRQLLQEGGEK